MSEEAKIERIISETPLFSSLTRDRISAIAKISEMRNFRSNEFIIHEGDVATGFFLILDGQVEVQRRGKPIGRFGRGHFFGETTLAQDETRLADVVAIQPTSCLVLTRPQLRELVEVNHQIMTKILEEIIRRNRVYYNTQVASSERIETEKLSPSGSPKEMFAFGSESAQKVFENLVDSFINDYMIKKFAPEKCGWRTATEVSRESGVPLSLLYGKQGGGIGTALEEPVRRGLIERRFFPGERGRGGEVARFKVAYDQEPIKSYVNEKIRAGRKGNKGLPNNGEVTSS